MTPAIELDEGMLDLFDLPTDPTLYYGLADDEIVIDCFAGGGGASLGIEWATGRSPDEAINHSAPALAIHEANHPKTRHHHSDIWEVDPIDVARGRRVGLLWLSPDCTHFSRAKGGKPVSKKIRVLAHVAVRYAKAVRPRVIMLENVEEFLTWGPVSRATNKPDPRRKGQSFRTFVRQLQRLGYVVDWRLLRGADFGSPTTRRRLFLVARCDGVPIRWPQATHGKGRAQPWHTAAECIDFSLPCPSIFMTKDEAAEFTRQTGIRVKRPLVPNTLRRVGRGVHRFVIDAAEPFIVPMYHQNRPTGIDEPLQAVTTQGNKFNLVQPFIVPVTHQGDARVHSVDEPMRTITGANRGEHALVAPTLIQVGYGERCGQAPRSLDIHQPLGTVVAGGSKHALVSAFLAKHFGGHETPGTSLNGPLHTVTETDHHALVAAHLLKLKGTCRDGQPVGEPVPTVQAQGNHHALVTSSLVQFNRNCDGRRLDEPLPTIVARDKFAEVRAFLVAYYGSEQSGGSLLHPLRTVTANDRFALVTLQGVDYAIADIGIRMLVARELANAQGFPPTYILSATLTLVTKTGRTITRTVSETAQKEMVGNSVNPHVARALVLANLGAPAAKERAA